jgi:elongation factor Ts
MLEKIKELRDLTNVSLQKCKNAIVESNGDIAQALIILQKLGLTDSAKKSGRVVSEGIINSYIHGGKIGVMVEINCETDFLAKSEPFKDFANTVVLQIASMNPEYISPIDVPQEIEMAQSNIYATQISEGFNSKPAEVKSKMLLGKMNKWLETVCLMNQISVLDSNKTIDQLRADLVLKSGENIVVKRMARWELGK